MPSLVTWGGFAIVSGRLVIPRRGAWLANLVVDSSTASNARATLSSNNGAWTLSGTPLRSGVFVDTMHVRVVGGAGGMSATATPAYYKGAPARLPLADLLADAGETLATDSDEAVTGGNLDAWGTIAAPVGSQLARLVEAVAPGAVWRVDAAGAIWCGVETWPASDAPGPLLQVDEAAACYVYGAEYPAFLPGVTVGGRRVSRVEHLIEPASIRTALYFEATP